MQLSPWLFPPWSSHPDVEDSLSRLESVETTSYFCLLEGQGPTRASLAARLPEPSEEIRYIPAVNPCLLTQAYNIATAIHKAVAFATYGPNLYSICNPAGCSFIKVTRKAGRVLKGWETSVNCFEHPELVAVAACSEGCGRALCGACARRYDPPTCEVCAPRLGTAALPPATTRTRKALGRASKAR